MLGKGSKILNSEHIWGNQNREHQVEFQKPNQIYPLFMQSKIQQLQQLESSDDEDSPVLKTVHSLPSAESKPESQLASTLKTAMFNFKYNLIHSNYVVLPSLQRQPICIKKDSSIAYLMGQPFDYHCMEKFNKRFQEIIWLSYRTSQEGISDVGWGCMIRVVQMVFAEVFQRCNRQLRCGEIIELFKEGTEHIFSLENICKQGDFYERWVSCHEVVSAMSSLLKSSAQVMGKSNICFHEETDMYHGVMDLRETPEGQHAFPKVIFISNKLPDCHEEQKKYYPHLQHMMKLKQFCGAAGGTGSDALYFVGFYEQKLILLDPHYAQDENEDKTTYFKRTPRGIPISKASQSFSLCFYFENLDAFREWIAELSYMQRIYSPYTVCQTLVDNEEEFEKFRKNSEDFQIL